MCVYVCVCVCKHQGLSVGGERKAEDEKTSKNESLEQWLRRITTQAVGTEINLQVCACLSVCLCLSVSVCVRARTCTCVCMDARLCVCVRVSVYSDEEWRTSLRIAPGQLYHAWIGGTGSARVRMKLSVVLLAE